MKFDDKEYLCFDDVLLVPQYSEIESRKNIDISTEVAGIRLGVPIISSNMDTITEVEMSQAMYECGGLGILHRYTDAYKIANWVQCLNNLNIPSIPSVGVNEYDKQYIKTLASVAKVHVVCIDVAHGHSKKVLEMIQFLRSCGFKVIAGNIATHQAALELIKVGADVVKVGIGPGSLCTTRVVTGSGVPQLSAIMNVCKAKDVYPNVKIIADGGIKSSGDIVKALAAGADAVMIGRLFSGCKETPGEIIQGKKIYRGMASFSAQLDYFGEVHGSPEGEAILVPAKGSVKEIVKRLSAGIKSGLSYSGVSSILELQEKATFIKVSSNTLIENGCR